MKMTTNSVIYYFLVGLICFASPLKAQSIMDKLESNGQTSQFAKAIEKTDLKSTLSNSGSYTVFAPTNKAFDQLSNSQKSNKNLLLNHILTGMATERNLRVMSDITSLSGKTIKLDNDKGLKIDSYSIIQSNIKASNGVIHIIDGVIK